MPLRTAAVIAAALLTLPLAACGSSSSTGAIGSTGATSATGTTDARPAGAGITIYSGRNENLVGPLLEKIEKATGVPVTVRYGDSSALAAQLLEEGDATPADVFFSQDAGALGALAKAGRLETLPKATLDAVEKSYADPGRHWVATSARARVVAYNPKQAPEAAKFTAIDEILAPKYKGKVGFAPTNASFHSFVTALRVAKGEEGAKKWLTDFKANQPKAYEKNGAVLAAVDSGEVDLGLINHYYWYELVAEKGADKVTARIRFLGADDPGALVNVAGAGVLKGADPQAIKVVDFLVSQDAQQYFVDETAEFPVVAGISTSKHDLGALGELKGSSVDLNKLDSLEQTLTMLQDVGLT